MGEHRGKLTAAIVERFVAAHHEQGTMRDDDADLFVTLLCERAADLALEAEVSGAFVQQLPTLSAWEWLALRALQRARNQVRADAEQKVAEKAADAQQVDSLLRKLGVQ